MHSNQSMRTRVGILRLLPAGSGAWSGPGPSLALVAGVAAGLLAMALPWPLMLLVFPVVAALWAIARWPEFGLLAILAYTSSILDEALLPPLSIGIGSLHLADLLLLYLFGLLGIRLLIDPGFRFRRTAADVPLALFVGLAILATGMGLLQGETPVDEGTRGLRHLGYLAIFFLITNLVRTSQQWRRLWMGVLWLAGITALASLLQSLLGPEFALLPGRIETVKTQGMIQEGVARIIPPGESLIYVGLILSTLALTRPGGSRLLGAVRLGLLTLGLLLTYRRMLWGSAILAVLGSLWLLHPGQRVQLLAKALGLSLATGFAIALVWMAAPESKTGQSIAAISERLITIVDLDLYRRGDPDLQTLEQRAIENRYALAQLERPSLLGTGLGIAYRPCLSLDDEECVNPHYLHNSYLAITLKLGLIGLLAFLWLVVVTLARGFRLIRQAVDTSVEGAWRRELVTGSTLAFAALLPAMLLEPYPFIWHWTPVIGLLLASIHAMTPSARHQGDH